MEMSLPSPGGGLGEALGRLARHRGMARAAAALARHADAIHTELAQTVLARIPAYSESRNPQVLPELSAHALDHTREIIRLFAGGAPGAFQFVRDHARRRAEQRFPLEASLHAYRCGHRVFSRWLRDATLDAMADAEALSQITADVADFAIEYTDAVSTVLASTYVDRTRALGEAEGFQRAELLNVLLEGHDESDGRVSGLLRDAGYLRQRQAFCVVVAQPVDPAEMLHPGRGKRLVDAIEHQLDGLVGRRLTDIRNNAVVSVVTQFSRQSGWTAPETALASRITRAMAVLGNSVLIGISNDAPSTAFIPDAYREARQALACADREHRVVQLAELPIRALLVRGAQKMTEKFLPDWSRSLARADAKAGGALTATLHAYADADMNVLRTGKRLGLHPNTVYARLDRVSIITGLDPKSFHALNELLIVTDCIKHASGR